MASRPFPHVVAQGFCQENARNKKNIQLHCSWLWLNINQWQPLWLRVDALILDQWTAHLPLPEPNNSRIIKLGLMLG